MLVAALRSVTLDCPQPERLAEFYRQVVGGELVHHSADVVYLNAWPVALAFQRVANHHPPNWPDPTRPAQVHLDFQVDGTHLDDAETHLLALGAHKPPCQPQPQSWRVLLDPAGHPFCLTALALTPSRREAHQVRQVDHGPLARFTERHRLQGHRDSSERSAATRSASRHTARGSA